jgi:energy-coupling factor transporter transmembrane protein EcfT
MNEIETTIAHYEADQARHRKLGFRFGFIAIGFLVLNMVSQMLFALLATNFDGASLGIFQLSEVFQIGLPVFGILGIIQRNKAVNARKMVESLQLVMLQAKNKPGSAVAASEPEAVSETAVSPSAAAAPKSSAASRAAKASKNKS